MHVGIVLPLLLVIKFVNFSENVKFVKLHLLLCVLWVEACYFP